jgi:hypothetical protein
MAFELVVEDGTGLENSNSYTTVAEADAFLEGQLHVSGWAPATNKAEALVTATRVLDALMRWNGNNSVEGQALGWPRRNARNPNLGPGPQSFLGARLSSGSTWPADQIPPILKQATALLAVELLSEDRTADAETKGIKRLSVGQGAIAIDFDALDRAQPIPDTIRLMLSSLGTSRLSSAGMRNVRRVQ